MDVKVKLILSITLFGIVTGALIQALLNYQFPEFYPKWYEGILAFFIILESLVGLYADSSSRKATQRQMLNVYMLTKVVKVFASLIFIATYAVVIKENIKSFVLIFMIFYLLFLAFEAYLFLRIEKRLKKKQQ